jgi:hypothetical protein
MPCRCIELDSFNMQVGKRNAALNGIAEAGGLAAGYQAEIVRMENARTISSPEARRAGREERLIEKSTALAKIEEQLAASDRQIATLLITTERVEVAVGERDVQLVEKRDVRENATARMAAPHRYVVAVDMSTSWRTTVLLRAILHNTRALICWPRSAGRNFLRHALLWICRRPRMLALARRAMALLPPLERRALTFARARSDALPQVEAGWMLEPATEALEAWQKLLRIPASPKG